MTDELILIKTARLRELEELESQLPYLIEKAVNEYKSNCLKRLHEKDKNDPAAAKERMKRYVEKHRDALNERRRQNRQHKKLCHMISHITPSDLANTKSDQVEVANDTNMSSPRMKIIKRPMVLLFN